MIVNPVRKLLAGVVLAAATTLGPGQSSMLVGDALAAEPAAGKPSGKPASAGQGARRAAARETAMPGACSGMQGVQQKICAECNDVPMFKRIVCQQRVFWSACKGRRLFEDTYCQQQSRGREPGD